MSTRWDEVWKVAPDIQSLLSESKTLEGAREKIVNYLVALDWNYRRDYDEIPSWDYILLKEAVRALMNIVSPRNERLAQDSALEHIWKSARKGDSDVEQDFIDEFLHLFKAIKGKADVYPPVYMRGVDFIDFDYYKGREAAIKRSDFLDDIYKRMVHYINMYPSGLEPEVVERRRANKRRILDALGATEDDWDDWKWQFRNVFKDEGTFELLKQLIKMEPDQERAVELAVQHGVPFGITPHYLHLMDHEPSPYDFAVRKQVLPPLSYVENMIDHMGDRDLAFDFMREHDTSPVDLITRRYPRVAILKPYDSCPQICVYCQRNWEITGPLEEAALAKPEQIDAALDWYAEHDSMMDVLLTGGDPMVLGDERLKHMMDRLAEMPHMRNIRIATRILVTVPQRITEGFCDLLGSYYETGKRTVCVVTHIEHPYEITPETAMAAQRVREHGIYIYNQQVFAFSTSRRFESVALRIAMKSIGVDPYYTFNMKGKAEIEEYSVPVARILQERKEEARLLPGIFRTDEPVFNVPFLGKNHLRAWQDHELIQILPDGRRVYSFHPWEKNIQKVKPYLYTDVTIKGYLDKLKERGEDPEEYKSIWYYY
jgi:lysine 2,3-aminomutase